MSWSWRIVEQVRNEERHCYNWRLTNFGWLIFWIVVYISLIFCVEFFEVSETKCEPDQKIENITRVLMHEHRRWTLIVLPANSTELRMIYLKLVWGYAKVINDVPEGQPMWARVIWYKQWGESRIKRLEIHIHSAKDINGAGWNHGKFGHGQTQVIE